MADQQEHEESVTSFQREAELISRFRTRGTVLCACDHASQPFELDTIPFNLTTDIRICDTLEQTILFKVTEILEARRKEVVN